MYSTRYSRQILMKLEFSRRVFQNYSNCMKLRLLRAEFFLADGQTETRTRKANSRFSQFCERPNIIFTGKVNALDFLAVACVQPEIFCGLMPCSLVEI